MCALVLLHQSTVFLLLLLTLSVVWFQYTTCPSQVAKFCKIGVDWQVIEVKVWIFFFFCYVGKLGTSLSSAHWSSSPLELPTVEIKMSSTLVWAVWSTLYLLRPVLITIYCSGVSFVNTISQLDYFILSKHK